MHSEFRKKQLSVTRANDHELITLSQSITSPDLPNYNNPSRNSIQSPSQIPQNLKVSDLVMSFFCVL